MYGFNRGTNGINSFKNTSAETILAFKLVA